MDSGFGARLKAQRERQHVTLETIAERTKIRLALLDGLERDDISLWPGGIFRRSYLRSYAAAIGLDPELAVQEFLARYPEVIAEPEAIASPEIADRRPPMRLRYLIASAMSALPQGLAHKGRKTPDTPEPAGAPLPAESLDSRRASSTAADHCLDAMPVASSEFPAEEGHEPFEVATVDVNDSVADEPAVEEISVRIDLPAMAQLCTGIVEATSAGDLERLLEDASRILHAVGIIVWLWDPRRDVLWPALSHGYPRPWLATLPALTRDADNPIGAAFRASARQVVSGGGASTSAIVVPVTTPGGCAGVLAVECANGLEHDASLQALATILAAQLSLLVDVEPMVRTAIA